MRVDDKNYECAASMSHKSQTTPVMLLTFFMSYNYYPIEQAFKNNMLTKPLLLVEVYSRCTMQPSAGLDKGTVKTSFKPEEKTDNCAEAGTVMFP